MFRQVIHVDAEFIQNDSSSSCKEDGRQQVPNRSANGKRVCFTDGGKNEKEK